MDYKNFRTTLRFSNKLNPKFWNGMELKPKVRDKMIEICDAWIEYALIPKEAVDEYVLVGGSANYNYTKFSDVDLHVIVDKQKISACETLLDEYLKDKKELWSLRDITIYGHDVELYAQDDEDEFKTNQAVYSLTQDKWLIEPQPPTVKQRNLLNDTAIISKINKYRDYINNLIVGESSNLETLEKIKEKLKKLRQDSIAQGGEYTVGNLVFKELRNLGILEKMNVYMKAEEDKLLSLK